MFRSMTLAVMLVLVAIGLTPTAAKPQYEIGYIDDGNYELESDVEPPESTAPSSLLLVVKNQFKDILVDVGIEIVKYIARCAADIKIRVLRRLANVTLRDVFQLIFDQLADLLGPYPEPAFTLNDIKQQVPKVLGPVSGGLNDLLRLMNGK